MVLLVSCLSCSKRETNTKNTKKTKAMRVVTRMSLDGTRKYTKAMMFILR